MAGRLGNESVTVQNLKVVKFDVENNLLLVKDCSSETQKWYLIINKSIKNII